MEEYLGMVKMFAGNFAPRGWVYCDGHLMDITQNTALFTILGTTYGGDGISTFGLPKLDSVKSGKDAEIKYVICVEGIYPSRD